MLLLLAIIYKDNTNKRMKNINKTKEKMKATIKNFNIDDVIYFDSKSKITLNKKTYKAIYNSNSDNYQSIAEIHNVDIETVNKIKNETLNCSFSQ